MSQEKVTKYKEEKANRKDAVKKQKRAKFIRNSVMGVLLIAIIGWVGYSAVISYQESKPRQEAEIDYTAIDEYINGLSEE